MIKNDRKSSPFGPEILSHEENPKQGFLDKVVNKPKDPKYPKPVKIEKRIDHQK